VFTTLDIVYVLELESEFVAVILDMLAGNIRAPSPSGFGRIALGVIQRCGVGGEA